MASVNKVILIGNLGRDPEVRYMPSGDALATLSIATTDTWKDKEGVKQERTEWHRVSMFSRLAEIAGEHLKKGSQIYIEGRIQTRKYTDKDGQERYSTEIVANEMKMLGSRSGGSHDSAGAPSSGAPAGSARDYAQQSGAGRPAAPAPAGGGSGPGFQDLEDDIPFCKNAIDADPLGRKHARRLSRARA